jgi:tetratricopeptide (TPR) repeat protein
MRSKSLSQSVAPSRARGPGLRTLALAWLLCGVALPLAVVAPAVTAASQQEPPALVARADALLAQGRAQEAEELYRSAVESAPGLIGAQRGLGRALAAQGRNEQAAAQLGALGEGLLSAGRYRTAAEILAEAVALAPQIGPLRVALGRALMLDQRFGEAASQLARALADGVPGALGDTARIYLGLALWESGRVAEAEATLRSVAGAEAPEAELREPVSPVSASPLSTPPASGGQALARRQLGRLLLWKGQYDEAAQLLAPAASEASPGGQAAADVLLDWARALAGAGRHEQALAAYDRAIALAPDRYPPRYSRARLLARLGRGEEAREEMERYRRLYELSQQALRDEGQVRARLDRGWELMAAGEAARAVEVFESFPDHPDALAGAAVARSALGQHAAAVAALERAITLAPDRQDLRLMLFDEREALR